MKGDRLSRSNKVLTGIFGLFTAYLVFMLLVVIPKSIEGVEVTRTFKEECYQQGGIPVYDRPNDTYLCIKQVVPEVIDVR